MVNGYIPRGVLVRTVVKYKFFRQWFSVMQLVGTHGEQLGYYADVDRYSLVKDGWEYYLTDLYLEFWIAPEGKYIELDRDEFEGSFLLRLITN